jgi:hypothetical protein
MYRPQAQHDLLQNNAKSSDLDCILGHLTET